MVAIAYSFLCQAIIQQEVRSTLDMYQVELNTLVSSIRNHMYVCIYVCMCMHTCFRVNIYV